MTESILVKISKVNNACIKIMLTFFVSNSALQCTAISLRLPNTIIIAVLFILLCIQIMTRVVKDDLKLFSKSKENNIWKYIKIKDGTVLLLLLVSAIWIYIIPIMNGFLLVDAISEAGMMIMFILYFPLAILLRMREIEIGWYKKVFYVSLWLLALWHIVMWSAEMIHEGAYQNFLDFMGSTPFFRVGELLPGWGVVRIITSNSILLGVGLIMTLSKIREIKIIDLLSIILFITAILGTFLRSLWVGAFFGVALVFTFVLVMNKNKTKKEMMNALVVGITIIISVVFLNATIFQNSIFGRAESIFKVPTDILQLESADSKIGETNKSGSKMSGTSNDKNYSENDSDLESNTRFDAKKDSEGALISNHTKIAQSKQLIKGWTNNPIIGFGYGSYKSDYLISEKYKYMYEMVSFSLLFKTGIIGIGTWLLFFGAMSIEMIRNKRNKLKTVIWFAIAGCYFITIQTNALLFTANSIALLIYLSLYTVVYEKTQLEKENDISSSDII